MNKRDHGEGSWSRVSTKKNGKIVGHKWKLTKRYGFNSVTGTYPRKVFYGLTKPECKEKAEAYEQKLALSKYVDLHEAEQKLSVWLPEWHERYVRSSGIKLTTEYDRLRHIRTITEILGNVAVGDLTPVHLDTLCGAITAKSSRYKAYETLKMAYKAAIKRNLIIRNPFDLHDSPPLNPKKSTEEGRALTTSEITALVQRTSDTRIGAMVQFMLETGVRIGEALALQQDDIDFENSKVTIRHTRSDKFGIGTTKSNKPRVLLLSQTTLDLLRKQLETIKAERLLRKRWENTNAAGEEIFVFPSEAGTCWRYSACSRIFRKFVRDLGFKDMRKEGGITFHSLRHTWATHALHAGVPINVVKERLGHSDIRTTLDIYGHILDGGEESAATVFADIFS